MRDYCQHGEPMDEHCPQCAGHTKAAANDSATAPVPAGGTPEGLAREKVEMAESEVKPSSPTTEAGRTLDMEFPVLLRDRLARQHVRERILAIEQQARDEGRREAVREREAVDELLKILPTSDSPLPDRQLLKDWIPEVARAADEVREIILDRVAGLDASESPPTATCCGHLPHGNGPCHGMVTDWGGERIPCDCDGRDASESPPWDDADGYVDNIYGDASESPPTRCDRIVNNGMDEPTECGRTLPCEMHDPESDDAIAHLLKYGCNVFHDTRCRWQRGDASESGR